MVQNVLKALHKLGVRKSHLAHPSVRFFAQLRSRHGMIPLKSLMGAPLDVSFDLRLPGASFEYHVTLDDPLGARLFWQDWQRWEPYVVPQFARFVRNSRRIVDIGAHTGIYSLFACALNSSCEVFAFEPFPPIYARLAENIHLNGFGGPYFHGHNVYAMAYDGRANQHRIWASTQNYWGTLLRSSDDFGKSWTNPQQAPIRFPSDTGVSLKNIWQIVLGRPEEPNVLYCGVEPAALFETRDAGETWSLVRGLFDHPHRARWMPGNGGLALHSIVLDPADKQRMYVAISAGGVYRTSDGGLNWTAQNQGIRAMFMPNKYPEFGQCVHKIAMHPSHPERLFLQNHWGLYRSDDCGESWVDIANGVPSDFGFAVVMHPRNPDCVYIVPVESDEFRCACDGRLRVYRTRNGGASWEPLMRGLPQKRAYETVLRDAMTADSFDPVGIYFGTRSGQLFGSRDEGRTWEKILEGLPSVVCVRTAVVEDASGGLGPAVAKAAPSTSHQTKSVSKNKPRRIKR
jgi:FkbM family methyltransferase